MTSVVSAGTYIRVHGERMEDIRYRAIGIIRSPFEKSKGMPIQPAGARGVAGTVEVYPDYAEGLKDLDGFSHIFLIYHFHLSQRYSLTVEPFLDNTVRGLFATRAPSRPNGIGISVVRLVKVEGCTLDIEDVDIVDRTPLLDIKPYIPEFDIREVERVGRYANRVKKVAETEADERFK